MLPTADNFAARRRFLTDQLFQKLVSSTDGKTDPFTNSQDYPRTFKIGKCEDGPTPDTAKLQVQVYWHQEIGSEKETTQKEVWVTADRQGDKWLIADISLNK